MDNGTGNSRERRLTPVSAPASCQRSLTLSTVVYARVPDSLKQALAARARERGLSLTAALVALLERGLDAREEERERERDGELAASTAKLERTRARLAEVEAALALAREGSS